MANEKISDMPTAGSFIGSSYFEIVEGGVNKKITPDQTNPFRGDYSGTNSFPTTGGRFTGGVPAAGDRWRLTNTLTIDGTDIYAPGTIIESTINTPGQTTGNWIKYAMQL